MVDNQDASTEVVRSILRKMTLSLDSPSEEWSEKKSSKINWRSAIYWGGTSVGILGIGIITLMGGEYNYNLGYRDGATSAGIQPKVECYHYQIQPSETINHAVSYFRTKEHSVTKGAILSQNGLTEDNLRTGEDITYCFKK